MIEEVEAVNVRTYSIQARASRDEFEALQAIARRQRRRPSEALRELVREKAKQLGLWPEETVDGPPTWQNEGD